MIIRIWDYLFTRREWKVIREDSIWEYGWVNYEYKSVSTGRLYILQDQFGNIKKKVIRA